jgi:hypothetical protein
MEIHILLIHCLHVSLKKLVACSGLPLYSTTCYLLKY